MKLKSTKNSFVGPQAHSEVGPETGGLQDLGIVDSGEFADDQFGFAGGEGLSTANNFNQDNQFSQQFAAENYGLGSNDFATPDPTGGRGQPRQGSSGHQTINPALSPSSSRASLMWQNAWQCANEGDYERAYKIVLKECDDIQLLKLVSKTGSVVRHLSQKTSHRVLNRLNRIMRSGTIQTMAISWFSEANTLGVMDRVDRKDKNEYLDALYNCFQKAENEQLKSTAKKIYKEIRDAQVNR